MIKIFLASLQDDSPEVVGRIYDHLVDQFGSDLVLRDVDAITTGKDIRQLLRREAVVILAVTNDWQNQQPADSNLKPDETRLEIIESAVKRTGRDRVIPILVGDAEMPNLSQLPENIRPVLDRTAVHIRADPNLKSDIVNFIKSLKLQLEEPDDRRAMAPPHQRVALPLHYLIVAVFGILALTSIAGGIYAISTNALSETQLNMLGVEFNTEHVGVSLVGIGFLITFFTIRTVLRSQHDLAALPEDTSSDLR